MTAIDYSVRYGAGFPKLASLSKQIQKCRCAGCGQQFPPDRLQLHHFVYVDDRGELLGDRFLPGLHGAALCGDKSEVNSCHWRVHRKDAWIFDKEDPLRGNRNTEEKIVQLQRNFAAISGVDPTASNYAELLNDRFSAHPGMAVVRDAIQQIPTTPYQIGSQPAPEQYYRDDDGNLINAPIAGDIAPHYQPSDRYTERLDQIAERSFHIKARRNVLATLDAIKAVLGEWALPLLGLATIALLILISVV
jgi:hypothetical protein